MHFILKLKHNIILKSIFRNFIESHGLKTMQAWQTLEYGNIDKLQLDHMTPIPIIRSPIDVLIKVHAASVNPLDVRMLGMIIY